MAAARSKEQFLALAERMLPAEYVATLQAPNGHGWEAFAAMAAQAARVSLAVSRADDALYTSTAPAAAYATVPVQFHRQTTAAGAFTIKPGSIVSNGRGVRFILEADVPVGANDIETNFVIVRAEAPGYEWNVRGVDVARDGTAIPGEVNTIERLETDPPFADPTLLVRNVDPGVGGAPPVLEQRGADRGIVRQPGEDAAIYRERVRSLPLVVTAPNLERVLKSLFAPYGIAVELVETFEPQVSGWFDATTTPGVEPTFVYDDPRPTSPRFRNHWMDAITARATFIVLIPRAEPVFDFGGCYDDPFGGDLSEYRSPTTGGLRGVLAYDLTNPNRVPEMLVAGYDGVDLGSMGLIAGAFESMERQKLGGVVVLFARKGA